jgi:hypothetical protein
MAKRTLALMYSTRNVADRDYAMIGKRDSTRLDFNTIQY